MQTFNQLGPEITDDADTVRALLSRFSFDNAKPPTNEQVVEWVSTFAKLAAEGTMLGDVGAFVRALSSFVSLLRIPIAPYSRSSSPPLLDGPTSSVSLIFRTAQALTLRL